MATSQKIEEFGEHASSNNLGPEKFRQVMEELDWKQQRLLRLEMQDERNDIG